MENKGWANPTPAGLVALTVACFCFFALLCGMVEKSAMPLLGCFLIGGFVIQIVVAILDLKGGNTSGGNTFLYFSAYFMFVSGVEMFLEYYSSGLDTRIDGWAWMALLLCGIIGIYLSAALVVNTTYGREVFKNPKPFYKDPVLKQ